MRNRDVESNFHKRYSVCNTIERRRSSSYAINNVEDDSNRFQECKLKIQKIRHNIATRKTTSKLILIWDWRLTKNNIDIKRL